MGCHGSPPMAVFRARGQLQTNLPSGEHHGRLRFLQSHTDPLWKGPDQRALRPGSQEPAGDACLRWGLDQGQRRVRPGDQGLGWLVPVWQDCRNVPIPLSFSTRQPFPYETSTQIRRWRFRGFSPNGTTAQLTAGSSPQRVSANKVKCG